MSDLKPYTNLAGRTWTSEERTESHRGFCRAVAGGLIPAYPDRACCWCGQGEGYLNWHMEDYSHPYRFAMPLCFRCHMIVHSRHWAPQAWRAYSRLVQEGWRWQPIAQQGAYNAGFATLARENGVRRGRGTGTQDLATAARFPCQQPGLPLGVMPFLNLGGIDK